jgi:hypothetical protein
LNGPASPALISYVVEIPFANDGAGGMWQGWGTAYNDTVLATGVQTINTTHVARIHGVIRTGATAGNLYPRFRSEVNGSTVRVMTYSWGALYTP